MFEQFEWAPPDAILGLTEAFLRDRNPAKINLSVGVYRDENGVTPILDCVKTAALRVVEQQTTKSYLGMQGSPAYAAAVLDLLFGRAHEVVASGRAVAAQAPGGTGALRVAGDFIKTMFPTAKIWLSDPTWANHRGIFQAAGVPIETYAYFDAKRSALDFASLLQAIEQMPAGDVILLHGCCHNPTGVDPTPEQWEQIAAAVHQRGVLPLLDFAYQGFAEGLEQDAVGLRALAKPGCEMLVCSSFSKNFGLYNERVGALTVVAETKEAAEKAMSHVKLRIRTNYSNPPAHGAAIVTTILEDDALRAQWHQELAAMRSRIGEMRGQFVEALAAAGVARDFSFIVAQRGMFSFSGLTKAQVDALRERDSIYIVGSGRINVAGMTRENMGTLCAAIARVLAD
ncbi:MAG: aspartate/tyrosine/aromatic aminotransferase [Planctomycetota bacterium]|nr:MAG: aspartate/tyrosine/aromatic aminotransferase [Planctomycetota bacterium]REJ89943.1 MAG: aspartate/tyrosine/aromatic aminotransferase [Planctomycetota bacterium]REK28175.1 MAG: aspartate/tyrosine/aromatic aminotransferase [Planctomycetota bacterium]REK42433.1 MAG: aspartate/tyrosine/aromatic aminotransferase [Planctomycetota bacterium]